jgi:acyl-CoA dehydrogenase
LSTLFTKEHEMLRQSIRSFIDKEILPHIDTWEQEGRVPRSVYKRMGELGFLGLKYPEEYGGAGGTYLDDVVLIEELNRAGSGGFAAAIGAHISIATPPIANFGNDEQKRKFLVPAIRGQMIGALGITEPGAGSDVASIRTTAVRDGDEYVVNGAKTFITNGVQADFIVTAVKTDPSAGHHGISLLVIETKTPGFRVGRQLDKLGWRASDTGELYFEDCRVPVSHRLGEENAGFPLIMKNFAWERIAMAIGAVCGAQRSLDAAIAYAKEREAFGRKIAHFQVIKHKLAEMATDIEAARQLTYHSLRLFLNQAPCIKEVAMAKNFATRVACEAADLAIQVHGGNGYMMDYPVQRYWRDARLGPIGGGTTEIMNEIIAKQLGL